MRFICGPSSPGLGQDLEAMVALADEDPDIEMVERRGDGDRLELVVVDMPQEKAEELKGLFPALLIEEDAPLEPSGSTSSLVDGRVPSPHTDGDTNEG